MKVFFYTTLRRLGTTEVMVSSCCTGGIGLKPALTMPVGIMQFEKPTGSSKASDIKRSPVPLLSDDAVIQVMQYLIEASLQF